jgi:surfactin synthase thioesterase subunit
LKKNLGRLSLVLLGSSLGGLLAFPLIGSHMDSKGVLREPFFLLPISVLLADAEAATVITAIVWRQAPDRL